MATVISFINQKGGVSKTTSCINIAQCLSELGKKILVLDMDPQANSSKGINIFAKDWTMYDVLVKEIPIVNCIIKSDFGFSIVPSQIKLANVNLEIANMIGRESLLKEVIHNYTKYYDIDYILIDCAPSLELLTLNCLTASTDVIIPVNASEYALDGIEDLFNTINLVKKKLNPRLQIRGALLTMVDERTTLSKDYKNDLISIFKKKVFDQVIHHSVDVARAQRERTTIKTYNSKSRTYQEYMNVAKEVISRD